jgi:hypothetical protein
VGCPRILSTDVNDLSWGPRRYQRKIYGKEESDDITVDRWTRIHPKKQDVVLDVTSYAEKDVNILGSNTCRVTLG